MCRIYRIVGSNLSAGLDLQLMQVAPGLLVNVFSLMSAFLVVWTLLISTANQVSPKAREN